MYPTGGGTATGTTVTTGTYSSGNAAFRWALEDGGSHMGILLHDTLTGSVASSSTVRYVECGQTVSLSQLNFIASYYSDDEYAFWPYWYSSNTSVATVNSSTGQITAHALGTATITLLMTDDYNGEEFTCQYTIVVPETVYRITNYYDSTAEQDANYISNIEEAINFLNTAFYNQFTLNAEPENRKYFLFVMNGTPSLDYHDQEEQYNPLEACDIAMAEDYDDDGEPDGVCDCESNIYTPEHLNHHRSVQAISHHFKEIHTRAENEIIVYWNKREISTMCGVDEWNQHEIFSETLACVVNKRPIIQIITPYGNTAQERIESMGILLAHEMAHVFLLDDQYDKEVHKPAELPQGSYYSHPACVMQNYDSIHRAVKNTNGKSFYQAILDGSDLAFCDTCAEAIIEKWRNIESSTAWDDDLYT